MRARRNPWAKIAPALDHAACCILKPAFRPRRARRSIDLGWPMGPSDGGFGRYECIELRHQGTDRVYAAGSEMRCDAVALAY